MNPKSRNRASEFLIADTVKSPAVQKVSNTSNKPFSPALAAIATVLVVAVILIAKSPRQSPTALTPQSATPATTTAFAVRDLGIRITIPPALADLEYVANHVVEPPASADFSSRSLTALGGPHCTVGSLGSLTISSVSPENQPGEPGTDQSDGLLVKPLGNKYLYYRHPQSTCSQNAQAAELESKQATAFSQAVRSAELIP